MIKSRSYMKYALASLLVLYFNLLMGQGFMTISGKVVDSKSQAPLPYVNLVVKGKSFGTVSNEAGEFIFHIPLSSGRDTLLITFIGYDVKELAILDIDKSKPLEIALHPKEVLLKGVIVSNKRQSAVDVIKEALKKISVNYADQTHILKGFFRDWKTVDFSESKGEEDNGVLIEAAINVIQPGYYKKGKAGRESIYVNEIRRSELPEKSRWNYHNSFTGLLNMNFVKYTGARDFVYKEPVLSFPNGFSFVFSDSLSDDQYIIIEASVPDVETVYTFYIDRTDYAIERIDFTNRKEFARGSWTIKTINNTQRFRKWNGKWYLSYIRRNWQIEKSDIKSGETIRKEDYNMEFMVNDIVPGGQHDPDSLGYLINPKTALEFQLKEYNEPFWKNYNIVKDNPLNLAVRTFFEKNTTLTEQFTNSGKTSLVKGDEKNLPEQVDDNLRWIFNRGDTLQGSLNEFRNCYDVVCYDLDIKIDPGSKQVSGISNIHFVVKEPTDKIQIDLNPSLAIQSIEWAGNQLKFSREYNAVFIRLPKPLIKGTNQTISVKYSGNPLEPDFRIPSYGAFVWSADKAGNAWLQSICQGSGANGWWPNKDIISDKPDSVFLTVTVPSNLINVSNGQLVWKKEADGLTTYRWKISYPVLNYNIAINAGDYIHWKESYEGMSRLTLNYYSLKENEKEAREAFKIAKPMMNAYENFFGPYPFPQDEFKLIQAPFPMEHQSCVSVGKDFEEDLILHESAHEWWGNSVSCTDMADIWIHEAFATYAVYLFKEHRYGKEQAAAYLEYLAKNIKGVSPLVGVYGVNHIHYDFTDAYSKGALLLHILRGLINNDLVWGGLLKSLQHDYKYKSINTNELIKYINDRAGQDFTYLFHQYLYKVGIPVLEVRIREGKDKLAVDYRWQNAVEDFVMPVRVAIGQNKFSFIYPTTSWKNTEFENLSAKDFAIEANKLMTTLVTRK